MSVSFIHAGNETMASFRYRVQIPASHLGWSINDETADTLIFSKPTASNVATAVRKKSDGGRALVDVCDAHLHRPHYQDFIRLADAVVVPTPFLAQLILEDCGVEATVIPDPYELPEQPPHTHGSKLFWFGHASNAYSLEPYLPFLRTQDFRLMSNLPGAIPWSQQGLVEELTRANIVVLPETAPYKSANRAIEAIRAGCFVVAEPHPSLESIPGIWVGNLLKGIEWAIQNPSLSTERLMQSQAYVREQYTPERVANAWKIRATA